MNPIARRYLAVSVMFFVPGIAMSSWIARTPAIRDSLGASTAEMGLVLLGLSGGAMVGILLSGVLVARLGTRSVLMSGMALIVAGLSLVAVGSAIASTPLVTGALAVFGIAMGGIEIAMNVEGADVEKQVGRPTLPLMHGFLSLGFVVGALLGMLLTAVEFPPYFHLAAIAALVVVATTPALAQIPSGIGRATRRGTDRGEGRTHGAYGRMLRDLPLWLMSFVVFSMTFSEGTANDWLPLIMVDGHGFTETMGSGTYAAFAASMVVARFSAGFFLKRFRQVVVVRVSVLTAAAGIALVALADVPAAAAAGVILWGLGTALTFPIAISNAGAGPDGAARVSVVASIGYFATLVAPPLLGFLGDHLGLRSALLLVLGLVVIASFLTPAMVKPVDQDEESKVGSPAMP
ncbi:MFS transporter [Georgenia sp. Marseille-Q6866]